MVSHQKLKCRLPNKGTLNYAAPEIFILDKYSGPVTDIFSAGIILFILVVGHPPFYKPDVSDIRYKHIMNNNIERFWELVWKNKDHSQSSLFSDDFKNLVNLMLSPSPCLRPSLSEIKEHPWMKGETGTLDEIKDYLSPYLNL